MLDDALATPARLAAIKVGLAVAVDVEQLRELRILQLVERRDVMGFRGRLVDEIACSEFSTRIPTLCQEASPPCCSQKVLCSGHQNDG